MIEQLPTHRDLLKHQQELPDVFRQSMLLVRFTEPILRIWLDEFMRIRLTRNMLASGEDDYWLADIVQPHRLRTRQCALCGHWLRHVSQTQQSCQNARCENFRRIVEAGPFRGVVKVGSRVRDERGRVRLNLRLNERDVEGAVLVLDRRYRESVLTGVGRAARQVADMFGWRLC